MYGRGSHRSFLRIGALSLAFALQIADASALPTEFTVDTLVDTNEKNPGDGVCEHTGTLPRCSLRAAVEEANANTGHDRIKLPPGRVRLTIAGLDTTAELAERGDLDITEDLTIVCPDPYPARACIVDGNAIDRIFDIQPGVTVTMRRFIVTNGALPSGGGPNDWGGAVRNAGTLTLDRMEISDSRADALSYPSHDRGGGISNENGATLRLVESLVARNLVTNGFGGGISNLGGTVLIERSVIRGNDADWGTSCFFYFDSEGGGIWIAGGSLSVSESRIVDNTAADGGGIGISTYSSGRSTVVIDRSRIDGNTVISKGGGIFAMVPELTIQRTVIARNTAEWAGGGIYIRHEPIAGAGTSRITRSRILSNVVTGTGCNRSSGATLAQGDAGGIFTAVPLELSRVTIANNEATANGGGLRIAEPGDGVVIDRTTISGNTSSNGGGIACAGPDLEITNSTLSTNTAGNKGGGLWLPSNGRLCPESMVATLFHATVHLNEAADGDGIFLAGSGNAAILKNSIVAENDNEDCQGPVTSQNYNLDSDDTCNLVQPNDLPAKPPQIGPLQDNGGPTWTHLPIGCGANPVDRIPAGLGAARDQRNQMRPHRCTQEGETDIGAVERQKLEPVP